MKRLAGAGAPGLPSPRAAVLGGALAAAAAGLLAALLTTFSMLSLTVGAEGTAESATPAYGVSARAQAEIPREYLRLYRQAAQRYGLDWAILAGIGKVECDHGRNPDPSCTKEGAQNSAGAGGPMQFLASTWTQYGVDGNGDGSKNRWDPADAIFAAANYLHASGAPGDYRHAIFAYNHDYSYVAEVERLAAVYRGPPTAESGPAGMTTANASVQYVAGERAVLSPADGHVALIPASAPAVVKAMVIAGNELQSLPYGPTGHPDPRGAYTEDCSSTVNYVLYRSGVRPIAEIVHENPLAQSYPSWGLPGPGRWVTIYATTEGSDHVFIVIAGLRLDTSHNGTDVGPNSGEDGPRWRILDHIPTWAHWSIRHPPGL